MPEKPSPEKRIAKRTDTRPNAIQKFAGIFVRLGKRLKSFFVNMKAELKRVVWPDRKKLIQNTATVLAICFLAGLILFVIDFSLGKILEGIGFYSARETAAPTTAVTTTVATSPTSAGTTIDVTPAAPTTQASSN